jgi:amino acid transporter
MVVGGLAMASIIVCLAEVASQFSEPGGPYLYVRTTFVRFAGIGAANWWWAKRRETQTQKVAEVVAATSVAD